MECHNQAAREGFRRCKARLLEPVMKVEVTSPEDFVGEVIGDLNSRRGQILDMGESVNFTVHALADPNGVC